MTSFEHVQSAITLGHIDAQKGTQDQIFFYGDTPYCLAYRAAWLSTKADMIKEAHFKKPEVKK